MTFENGLSPDTKSGRLRQHCLDLLKAREGDPDGLPTNNRFIYYELVARGIISKSGPARTDGKKGRRSDQDLADALFWLRDRGLIPWSWIVDETRSVITWRSADSIAAYVQDSVARARLDLWADDPPIIVTESRSLAGVLESLVGEYLVPIAATNGQCGGFLRTDLAPALSVGQRVLYLGDHDWQGDQIEANTQRVLEREIGGELAWERLAITSDQVDAYNLPRIRKPDKRYKPHRYHDAVETEALGQGIIVGIVRARLNELLPEPLATVLEREQRQRVKVQAALARIARGER
jgi:hypothetical protein